MVVGIARAEEFSPNSVRKDRTILEAVISRMYGVVVAEEEACRQLPEADVYMNMGRMPETMMLLKQKESTGALVLNSAYGVECCQRSRLELLMRKKHFPMPAQVGPNGYWLKRGDRAAQTKEDIVFCKDEKELELAKRKMEERGIEEYTVSAHVKGDLVKFYGVESVNFFRVFYPGDDGESKFGNEHVNGKPHHFLFHEQDLQTTAECLSRLVNIPIFGGDAVITADGTFKIIDFNDWPSFSRCVDEAADAIVKLVMNRQ
ncbi:MAG: hypothetical protein IJV27_06415 [Prevotella sp.]|nr:hypothetical protein [Prevotella sp.]